MKVLILYDSLFGNTEMITQSIYSIFPSTSTRIKSIESASVIDVGNTELLIVGSPTQGGKPKQSTQEFLESIPEKYLSKIKFAAFDTRLIFEEQNFALKALLKLIGYAAPKMSAFLKSKGATEVIFPEGFFVKGKEGPLAEGELLRAKNWGKKIMKLAS